MGELRTTEGVECPPVGSSLSIPLFRPGPPVPRAQARPDAIGSFPGAVARARTTDGYPMSPLIGSAW